MKRKEGGLGAVSPEKFLTPRPLLWLRMHLPILEQLDMCDAKKALLVNYRLCFAADCCCCVDFEFCSVILLVNLT